MFSHGATENTEPGRQLRQSVVTRPARTSTKWTDLTRREISRRLAERGTPAGKRVVGQLLKKHGYVKRKARKKVAMGPRHPDRNAQFQNIARLKQQYLSAGQPVLSMDTKKKELLGSFYRDGRLYTRQPIEVFDHDFPTSPFYTSPGLHGLHGLHGQFVACGFGGDLLPAEPQGGPAGTRV
ncbi:MAG: hypothetical protein IT440_14355, partial [Phycisphaeraceae bacterium]|nr:hypothetical protein [Phycisphaeraceae bacterium]